MMLRLCIFMLLCFDMAAYTLPSYEYDSLFDLFEATNGDEWVWSIPYYAFGYPWDFSSSPIQNPCNTSHLWQGIVCSSDCSTSPCNVITISLSITSIHGPLPPSIGNLTALEKLDLSNNYLTGTIPSTIGNITTLQYLFLNNNHFHGTIPSTFQHLLQLRMLYLYINQLTGSIPTFLGNFSELLQLQLYANQLHGSLPSSLGNLHKVYYLMLSSNLLTGTIPSSFGALQEVTYLSLSFNDLHGGIPSSLGNLSKLQNCFLSSNLFTSSLPPHLGNLTSLFYLDMHANAFTGSIPSTLGNLHQLVFLSIYDNHLGGKIPKELGQITTLISLYLYENLLTGSIPPSFGNNSSSLSQLFLYSNTLTGRIPDSLGSLPHLQDLLLFSNTLTGPIPSTFVHLTSLQILDLSSNYFTGTAPRIGNTASSCTVVIYNLRNNYFSGTFPTTSFLCQCHQLQQIDCTDNILSGPLVVGSNQNQNKSNHETVTCFASLVLLQLSNNQFTGLLPSSLIHPALTVLYLDQNAFTGSIPEHWFESAFSLQQLSLAENCLSGTIPNSICNSQQLQQIYFDGLHAAASCVYPILPWYTQSGYYTNGAVVGTVPACVYAFPNMSQLQLSGNQLHGTLPIILSHSLTTLNIANNQFSGTIPAALWDSTTLLYIDISFNRIQDTFPAYPFPAIQQTTDNTNTNMSSIGFYFENNRFSGRIPEIFVAMENINLLEGNQFLCALDRSDLPQHDPSRRSYECGSDTTNTSVILWMVFCFAISSIIVLGVYYATIHSRHTPHEEEKEAEKDEEKDNGKDEEKSSILLQQKIQATFHQIKQWWERYEHFLAQEEEKEHSTSSSSTSSSGSRYRYILQTHRLLSFALSFSTLMIFIGLVVLLPLYITLHAFYRTHDYPYIWVISSSYLTGAIPAILLCLVYLVVLLVLFWMSCWYDITARTTATTTLQCRRQNIAVESVHTDTLTGQDTSPPPLTTPPSSWIRYLYIQAQYALFLCLNMLVVCGVNMAYVYIVVVGNYDISIITIASLVLSMFKVVWNSLILGGPLYRIMTQQFLVEIHLSGLHFLYLSLFNNIFIPYLAQALVSPTCFLYAIRLPPSIHIYVAQYLCKVITSITDAGTFSSIQCNSNTYNTASYYPTFTYAYQCSSSLVTAFAHVFIYRYLISAFLMPMTFAVIQSIIFSNDIINNTDEKNQQQQPHWGQIFIRCLRSVLPTLWRLRDQKRCFDTDEPEQDKDWLYFHESVQKSPFGNLLAIEIMTSIAMMLTFGISFPLLIVIIGVSICCHILCYYLLMGRWISLINQLSQEQNNEKERRLGLELMQLLVWVNAEKLQEMGTLFSRGIFLSIAIASMFQAFILFDILGEDVGAENAYWIVVVMISMIVALLGTVAGMEYAYSKKQSSAISTTTNDFGSAISNRESESVELTHNPIIDDRILYLQTQDKEDSNI